MKRRSRTFITRIIVFLLLGAIVNVAVAWTIMVRSLADFQFDRSWSKRWVSEMALWYQDDHAHMAYRLTAFGYEQVAYSMGQRLTPKEFEQWPPRYSPTVPSSLVPAAEFVSAMPWSTADRVLLKRERPVHLAVVDECSGWPMHSVGCTTAYDQPDFTSVQPVLSTGIEFRSGPPRPLKLPTTPRWPGFAINTIFYAAILWLLFFAPGSMRRVIRRRRGLCPACAYPVGTSPVCTECGKPIPVASRVSKLAIQ